MTIEEASFDECEAMGLDGILRTGATFNNGPLLKITLDSGQTFYGWEH